MSNENQPAGLDLSQRRAGVLMHVTSLPGEYGIGSCGAAARQFVDTLCEMGFSVWQVLPTGPTAYGDSPYQPLSSFAGNEMLIDIADLVERGYLAADEVDDLLLLPHDHVDYGHLIPLKQQALARAADRFDQRAGPDEREACARFLHQNDAAWLHDYALFRILKALHQERAWPEWAPEYVHRDAAAMRGIERSAHHQLRELKTLQYLFHRQWSGVLSYARSRGVRLLADIPIYIALDSADAWSRRELLQIDADGRPLRVAGVPPDYFSADGQLWGNPLYDWPAHAREGYAWWVERVRHATAMADMVRIDHFRGFESYWSIPASAQTARDGEWVAGPGDALFDALRKALGNLPIVAEDLGIITDAVTALRERQGFPGMQVLQFLLGDDHFDARRIPRNSICYTGTHDNDTTVGWFHGGPGDTRSTETVQRTQAAVLRATQGSAESVHLDVLNVALGSDAHLAIAPMQDLLGAGSSARMNVPGTTYGNWRWRIQDGQPDRETRRRIREMVDAAGRTP